MSGGPWGPPCGEGAEMDEQEKASCNPDEPRRADETGATSGAGAPGVPTSDDVTVGGVSSVAEEPAAVGEVAVAADASPTVDWADAADEPSVAGETAADSALPVAGEPSESEGDARAVEPGSDVPDAPEAAPSAPALSAADLEVFPGAFEQPVKPSPQAEPAPAGSDTGGDVSAPVGEDASAADAPAAGHSAAVSEPARPSAAAPDRNPWNDPLPASYGGGSGVTPPGAPTSAAPAGGSRRGMPGWLVAVIAAVVVVAAVAIAFAGPSLLAPDLPEPEPQSFDRGLDPLDHDNPLDDEDIQGYLDDLEDAGTPAGDLTADEQAVYDVVAARLDALAAADASETELIGSLVSEGFYEQMEVVSLEMCGVDPQEYARTMLDGLTYTIDSVYVSAEGDTALVSATVTCRDVFEVIDEFNAMMEAYTSSEAYEVSSLAEDYERVGIMFMEAARTAGMNDGYTMDIYLDRDGDTWTIDETMWEMELDYLFDVA